MLLLISILSICLVNADLNKDRIQPSELDLPDVPKFIIQPESVMYTMKNMSATLRCRVSPANHVSVICSNVKYTIGPSSKLMVERFNEKGKPDVDGVLWDIRLEITHEMVRSLMDDYRCHCEAWNNIKSLQSAKFVDSESSHIIEAYMEQDFMVEPISANLTVGSSLTLSCQPPNSNPSPEVYWMKNGVRITQQNQLKVLIDQYNHLIMEDAEPAHSGNYTCVANLLDREFRYIHANVTITEPIHDSFQSGVDTRSEKQFDGFKFGKFDPRISDLEGPFTKEKHFQPNEFSRRDIALFAGLFCAGTAVFIFIGLALLVISRRANSSLPEKRYAANHRSLFIDANTGNTNDLSQFTKLTNPISSKTNFMEINPNQYLQYPPHSQAPLPPKPNTYQIQSGIVYPPTYINCPKQVNGEHLQNASYNHILPLTPKQSNSNTNSNCNKLINSSTPSTNSTIVMNSSMQSKLPNFQDDFHQQQQRAYHNNYSMSGGSSGSNTSNQIYPPYPQNQTAVYLTDQGLYQEPISNSPVQLQTRDFASVNKSSSYVYDSVLVEHNYEDPNQKEMTNPSSSL